MANHTIRGQQRDKPFKTALLMEAKALENGELNRYPKGSLRWNAQQLLMQGEPAAIKEIADRLDGKVPQAIGGSDELEPIAITAIVRSIVDPADSDSKNLPPAAGASEV